MVRWYSSSGSPPDESDVYFSFFCTCGDVPPAGQVCKHETAAIIARAKSGVCAGCGLRFCRRDLVDLDQGNHDDLTYFDGDRLCRTCADNAGVAY
jgi:hypothetical protein